MDSNFYEIILGKSFQWFQKQIKKIAWVIAQKDLSSLDYFKCFMIKNAINNI